ncbi:MAG: M56 family metallopeptidase [Lachnospiraceae bacterium]|nr:M56 family metallopeptidase [Lachnospiraceae bacterium]
MQWSDFCFCVVLMDIFGTIGSLLYLVMKKWLDRASARLRLVLIKLIICLYMIPTVYPILRLSRIRYMSGSWVHIGEFGLRIPDRWELVFQILGGLWFSGLLIGIAVSVYHYSRLDRTLRWNQPVTGDGWKQAIEKYLGKYQLASMKVYQNETVQTTLVTGLFRPMIIVPLRDYSRKQMSMMMEHEAWHVRRRDLLWKKLALFVSWLHWFNPLVYWLREILTLEQEIVCDISVCDINPEYTAKEYCQFLYDVEVKEVDRMFAVTLIETGLSLEQRIMEMVKRNKVVRMNRRRIWACGLVFVITAAIPTVALANGVVYIDETLRETGEMLIEEEPLEPAAFLRELDDGSVAEVCAEPTKDITAKVVVVEITVGANSRYLYPECELAEGDYVTISVCCDDTEALFRIGIKNSDTGEMMYIEGSDVLMYSFVVESAGRYSAFVQNCAEKDAKFEGMVMNP